MPSLLFLNRIHISNSSLCCSRFWAKNTFTNNPDKPRQSQFFLSQQKLFQIFFFTVTVKLPKSKSCLFLMCLEDFAHTHGPDILWFTDSERIPQGVRTTNSGDNWEWWEKGIGEVSSWVLSSQKLTLEWFKTCRMIWMYISLVSRASECIKSIAMCCSFFRTSETIFYLWVTAPTCWCVRLWYNINASWWLNQPLWKICSSNWIMKPQFLRWT